ncbi:MAG TPA: DinB family protein [Candidatus Limnocylindrales bacterium]|nr:DinB family protein [Candidatus Limnocylindrales bacterium]
MTEEQQRIRSYLTAQGAKLAPPDLVDKVRQAMGELREAAMAVPTARFGDRPAPEEWSGNEVMAHVLAAGRYFGGGILSALDGAPAPDRMAGQGTEGAPRRVAADWWADLQRDREALFARVLAADPGARLDRTVEHRMFGPLNWREALLFMRIHDLDHAGQLKKIAAAFA